MGGTQFKYQQISEFNFEFITKTDKIVFNHDFSLFFMIQQSQIGFLLQILQFKSETMKIISKQRIDENQVSLLPYKNCHLFLKTYRHNGGIHLNSIAAQNNKKYLIRLQIKKRLDEISKNISCLIMNENQNLIVSGGCIFNGQKRANLEFWTSQNGWRVVQTITNSDIDDSNVKKICFNKSETAIIAIVRIRIQYYIIIYHYEISNQFWVEQNKLKMQILNQFQLINDNILVVRQKKVKSNILGNCSLKDVLGSYVLNQQNGQFVFKMEIDDQGSIGITDYINLVYCPNKKILVSIRQGFLKFIKIKDDGRISIQQIISLEFNYDYLSISQDLRYFVICQKQLMRVFQLNEL